MKTEYIIKEIGIWLIINLIIPIFVPILFLFCISKIETTTTVDTIPKIFIELLRSGFYIFAGTMLIISVFQDYKEADRVVKPVHYLILLVLIILTGLVYIGDNTIIPVNSKLTFANDLPSCMYILSGGILMSGYLKVKVLLYKLERIRTS